MTCCPILASSSWASLSCVREQVREWGGKREWHWCLPNMDKVMTFCACWHTHTNPICVWESGGILRDKAVYQDLYSSLLVCPKENGVRKTYPRYSFIWALPNRQIMYLYFPTHKSFRKMFNFNKPPTYTHVRTKTILYSSELSSDLCLLVV